jgi:hypothetical protein
LKLIFAFLIFTSINLQADILFIDTNNSPKEIEAAQKAAQKRGEKLIVFPEMRKEFTNDEFNAYLKKMDSEGKKLSSVVLSGHNGNGHFSGNFGEMTSKSLSDSFKSVPNLVSGVRSMMLWGCYTTTLGSIQNFWKKSFPQLELLAGFDGIAPANDKKAGWEYLEDVLVQEKKITQTKDEAALKKAFKGLSQINVMNAALCTSENFTSHKKTFKISEAYKACSNISDQIQNEFMCYYNATEERCKNVPANTSSGELRKIYNLVQDNYHCNGATALDGQRIILPNPDTIIRLIFFENVKKNTQKLLGEINFSTKLNDILKTINADKSLNWPDDISKMSRQEILGKLNNLKTFVLGKSIPAHLSPESSYLKSLVFTLDILLGSLELVPFAMVEPNVNASVLKDLKNRLFSGLDNPQGSIQKHRFRYESNRANDKVSDLKSIYKESDASALEHSNNIMLIYRKYDQATSEGEQQKINSMLERAIYDHKVKVLGPHVSEIIDNLKSELTQDYPHAEGKKIYDSAIEKEISELEKMRSQYIESQQSKKASEGAKN